MAHLPRWLAASSQAWGRSSAWASVESMGMQAWELHLGASSTNRHLLHRFCCFAQAPPLPIFPIPLVPPPPPSPPPRSSSSSPPRCLAIDRLATSCRRSNWWKLRDFFSLSAAPTLSSIPPAALPQRHWSIHTSETLGTKLPSSHSSAASCMLHSSPSCNPRDSFLDDGPRAA